MTEVDRGVAPQADQDATAMGGLGTLLRGELNVARWAAIGGAAFLLGEGAVLFSAEGTSQANPNSVISCDLQSAHHNTLICGMTKQEAEDTCALAVRPNPDILQTHSGYVSNSRSKYQVTFRATTPGGCVDAGTEEIYVKQLVRDGPSGQFEPNGKAEHVPRPDRHTERYGSFLHTKAVMYAPYDCTKLLAGSAVEPVVTVKWIPKRGWSSKGTITVGVPGPERSIC